MTYGWTKGVAIAGLAAVALLASLSPSDAGLIIDRGWDLFQTAAGARFDPDAGGPAPSVAFTGVPLGSFDFTKGTDGDFGRAIGVLSTGPVIDTIVKRRGVMAVPGPESALPQTAPPIPIEMVALQLRSVGMVDFGLGTDFYFVTLQSDRGVGEGDPTLSPGTMTITFGPEGDPHGTFDSALTVAFDVRKGSLTGPIAASTVLPLTADDVPWAHTASHRCFGEKHAALIHPICNDDEFNNPRITTGFIPGALVSVPEPVTMSLVFLSIGTLALIGWNWRWRGV